MKVLENSQAGATPDGLVDGMKKTVTTLLAAIHDMALELRPTTLDDLGLAAALAQYTRACRDDLGISVDYEAIGFDGPRLPHEVETALYRIIQEAITNVVRHSGAQRASVLLEKKMDVITAIIEDNGAGFDLKDVRATRKTRLGLYGMQERAALVGGKLTIESRPGVGTTVYVEIPLHDA
jgi:signal transduction histidine kinase